jgi:hypothetical protein
VRLAPRVRTGAKLVMGTPRDFNAQLIARRQASPVLRPSEPCSFHPFKSLVSSFVLRGFGQLQAVVGVLSISVRLLASWSLPYATTCLVKLAGRRTALTGSIPPCFVGRPRDFLFTGIDFFIFSANRNCEPRGSANFRPGTNQATHESNPMAFAEKHDISLD